MAGHAPLSRQRQSGLRLTVRFAVIEVDGTSAILEAVVEEMEILHEGKFIRGPFLQFNPPDRFLFPVDFKAKVANFSSVRKAFTGFSDSLKGTFASGVMGGMFDPIAYSAQLGDLLRLPPLAHSGRRYPAGQSLVEWVRFYLPLIGPSVSFGPFPVMQSALLERVTSHRGRPVASIVGETSSEELGLSPEELQDRFALFQVTPPVIYESQGSLKGMLHSLVSTETGWTLEASSSFRSLITANFEGGELAEEIYGEKSVALADPPKP
jgi:hypothetical protein